MGKGKKNTWAAVQTVSIYNSQGDDSDVYKLKLNHKISSYCKVM